MREAIKASRIEAWMKPLRLVVPSKGRLKDATLELLEKAGIKPSYLDSRALIVPTNKEDLELVFARPEDIPWIVESGAAEMGITGHDYVVESGRDVAELLDLGYGFSRIVLAVPRDAPIRSPEEIPEGFRIATKFVNIASEYVSKKGLKVRIIKISGSAEVMPGIGAADGIIDVTSTGTTLKLHGLVPIDTILTSSARLISRKELINDPRVESIKLMVEGVIRASKKKLIMMNVPQESLDEVLKLLPAMSGPTVSKVESERPMWEVMAAVDEEEIAEVVLKLKKAGARDILVLNIERLVP